MTSLSLNPSGIILICRYINNRNLKIAYKVYASRKCGFQASNCLSLTHLYSVNILEKIFAENKNKNKI